MKTSKLKSTLRIALIGLLTAVSFVAIGITQNTIHAYGAEIAIVAPEDRESEQPLSGWEADNIIIFANFLQSMGYNFNCHDDVELLALNIMQYYYQALNDGLILPFDYVPQGDCPHSVMPFWEAGGDYKMVYGNGGTHQVLAGRAIDYALGRFPTLFGGSQIICPDSGIATTTARRAFVRYSDWPDTPESGERGPRPFNVWSNNRHFYNPNNGRNYFNDWIEPGVNARTRTSHFFDRAVGTYLGTYHPNLSYYDRRIQAITYLGKASHFISDIASPVHTGDQLIIGASWMASYVMITLNDVLVAQMGWYHSAFESIAQEELNRIASGQITDFFPSVNYRRHPDAWSQATHSARISQ